MYVFNVTHPFPFQGISFNSQLDWLAYQEKLKKQKQSFILVQFMM